MQQPHPVSRSHSFPLLGDSVPEFQHSFGDLLGRTRGYQVPLSVLTSHATVPVQTNTTPQNTPRVSEPTLQDSDSDSAISAAGRTYLRSLLADAKSLLHLDESGFKTGPNSGIFNSVVNAYMESETRQQLANRCLTPSTLCTHIPNFIIWKHECLLQTMSLFGPW